MGPIARALVGVAVVCASSRAFAESAPPPQQAAPQQAAPQQAPVQPAAKNPPVSKKTATNAPPPAQPVPAPDVKSPPLKKTAKTAPKKLPPLPKAAPKTDAQINAAGDGAPAPAARCKVAPIKGTPLFEARFASGPKIVDTRLYATGTFTRAVMKEQTTACIDAPQLAEIRIALKESPWKTTKSPATCNATTGETTQIYAAGTLRFTSRTCNPLVLDKLSSHALDLIAQDVGAFGLDLATEVVEGN
jgi:hypothetical protein